MYFLTINAGSSSLKFSVFAQATLAEAYTGAVTGIGFDTAKLTMLNRHDGKSVTEEISAPNHHSATEVLSSRLSDSLSGQSVSAIGFRVVHGGPYFDRATIVNDELVQKLRSIISWDSEHLNYQIALIEQLRQAMPDTAAVACFDTAFFRDLPVEAKLLPIPRKYEAQGLHRYGFHGLSYEYLLRSFEEIAGHDAANGKIIIAHLGNGASLAALKDGKPLDTSMGLTPSGGIPMSTRSGDLDPGILNYFLTQENFSPAQLHHLTSSQSGLLGISETTSDMEKLLQLEADDHRAKEAVDIFCYHVRKFIGAYAAALGGLNSLIFSGGMGEVAPKIRARVCQGLEFLGVQLDDSRNQADAELISTDGAPVGVHVLKTNEALTIAREMKNLLVQKEQ